jgi:hypothetical protein
MSNTLLTRRARGELKMKKDPIVEEVRKFREEHARTFNYDLNKICKDLKKKEKKYGNRVITLPAKQYLKKTG